VLPARLGAVRRGLWGLTLQIALSLYCTPSRLGVSCFSSKALLGGVVMVYVWNGSSVPLPSLLKHIVCDQLCKGFGVW